MILKIERKLNIFYSLTILLISASLNTYAASDIDAHLEKKGNIFQILMEVSDDSSSFSTRVVLTQEYANFLKNNFLEEKWISFNPDESPAQSQIAELKKVLFTWQRSNFAMVEFLKKYPFLDGKLGDISKIPEIISKQEEMKILQSQRSDGENLNQILGLRNHELKEFSEIFGPDYEIHARKVDNKIQVIVAVFNEDEGRWSNKIGSGMTFREAIFNALRNDLPCGLFTSSISSQQSFQDLNILVSNGPGL